MIKCRQSEQAGARHAASDEQAIEQQCTCSGRDHGGGHTARQCRPGFYYKTTSRLSAVSLFSRISSYGISTPDLPADSEYTLGMIANDVDFTVSITGIPQKIMCFNNGMIQFKCMPNPVSSVGPRAVCS